MGMRFRKSFSIAPGVRFNVGSKSMGVSVGNKFGGVSYNTRTGTRARVSAPGTGLSYYKKIGSSSTNTDTDGAIQSYLKAKNKWIAFWLCLCLGFFGAHKFYEGKFMMGLLYSFTFGLFGIGWMIDTVKLLCKSNPYYI